MKEEKIKAVLKEKIGDISRLSAQVGVDFDKDCIHEFRVQVKTIRSFLRLLRMHQSSGGLKMPRKFKRLYQLAGIIRDTQLEFEKLEASNIVLPQYNNKLQHALNAHKKEWHKRYNKKILSNLEKKLMKITFKTLHPAVLENFFTRKLAVIDKTSKAAHPADEQVHNMRKQVKDILYTAKLAKKNWAGAKDTLKIIPAKELDKLANALGDYNDRRITLGQLSSFSSGLMENSEKNTIKKGNDIQS